jgi:hypothetical protein
MKKRIILISIIVLFSAVALGITLLKNLKETQSEKSEQDRLKEMIVRDINDQKKKMDEKEVKTKEQADNYYENLAAEKERNKNKTLEERLVLQLADKNNNNEPLSETHIIIDQQIEHYIKGRVFFDNEPKKNGIFYAAEKEYFEQDGRLAWKDMAVVYNEGNELINCGIANEYSFPDSMKSDCVTSTNNKNYQAPNSLQWALISGDPGENCSRVLFSGKAVVYGWYEWGKNYAQKDWVLAIKKEDRGSLLPYWSGYYKLTNAPDSLNMQLKKANEENPVRIIIRKMGFYCEGLPSVSL